MSVLTKVFVVLVTVMSVLLVAMIVPFVANTTNYRGQVDKYRTRADLAETKAAQAQTEIAAVQESVASDLTNLRSQIQNQMAQVNMLTQRLATAETSVQGERAKNGKFEADLSRLAAAQQQQAEINKAMQDELGQRRSQMLEEQKRMIELVDRNSELQGQLGSLTRQVRMFQEQLTQLQERNTDLETALGKLPPEQRAALTDAGTSETATPYEPQTPIRGKVTVVETAGDQTFVQIDVGTNDGVAPNMKFLVSHDGQFLGNLVISTVDRNSSAGRMALVQGTVSKGDIVLTGGY